MKTSIFALTCLMASTQLIAEPLANPRQNTGAISQAEIQFDDSVGNVGPFMAPDACNNIVGYQAAPPAGYGVVDGACIAPCAIPSSTTSVTQSACPVGQTGQVVTTTTTSYTCPSTYGSPTPSASATVANNCQAESPNGVFFTASRNVQSCCLNTDGGTLDVIIKRYAGNYYVQTLVGTTPTASFLDFTNIYALFQSITPGVGKILSCSGSGDVTCSTHLNFNGYTGYVYMRRTADGTEYFRSSGAPLLAPYAGMNRDWRPVTWCGGMLPGARMQPSIIGKHNDNIWTTNITHIGDVNYMLTDVRCRN